MCSSHPNQSKLAICLGHELQWYMVYDFRQQPRARRGLATGLATLGHPLLVDGNYVSPESIYSTSWYITVN